jgi:hypothetical protein
MNWHFLSSEISFSAIWHSWLALSSRMPGWNGLSSPEPEPGRWRPLPKDPPEGGSLSQAEFVAYDVLAFFDGSP